MNRRCSPSPLGEGRGEGRRRFLTHALAIPAVALAGCKLSFEQGIFNDCRSPRGNPAMSNPRVAAAWEGLRADRVWDSHAHLFGNGRSGQGLWVNPDFDKPSSLAAKARRMLFANAGCVGEDESKWDERMISRLTELVEEFPPGAKVMLLAFDFVYDESGVRREDLSSFCVPNDYAMKAAQANPARFEWIASVHPYRADAIEALEQAKAGGARAVKWLPPSMGIDPASNKCVPLYDALKRLDLPLLVHVGEEQAVAGAERHEFGNPLRLRHPLGQGVRVIAAHCASLGLSPDIDAKANSDKASLVPNFQLFARLMSERRYEGLLFGDLAATTQANRAEYLPKLLANREWHARLLNGSDYPLPGVMPLFSLSSLVQAGVLPEDAVPAIKQLRDVNSLAFDFVLKRSLRYQGQGFANACFETRDFFL